ncbi:MAG: HAD hydrolase-like protein [Candidatus Woesearchaeota archaeon]
MKQKAIIFDFDDTLVMTKEISINKHKEAARRLGISFDENELIKRWGMPWPALLHEFMGDRTEEFISMMGGMDEFRIRRFKGANKAISEARGKGALLGILSSSERDWILQKSKDAGIRLDLFEGDLVFSSEDVRRHKPHPKSFEVIIDKLKVKGISKSEITYCGDSLMDFRTSSAAGVNFIAVTTGFATTEDFIREGVERENIIDSIAGLPEILDKSEGSCGTEEGGTLPTAAAESQGGK